MKNTTYTQEDVESILFTYAEQHGLTSTKSEVDDFNVWVTQYFEALNK